MMQRYVHNILKIHQRVNVWIWRAVQWHHVIVITTLQKLTTIFHSISLKFEINERIDTTAELSSLSLNECNERVSIGYLLLWVWWLLSKMAIYIDRPLGYRGRRRERQPDTWTLREFTYFPWDKEAALPRADETDRSRNDFDDYRMERLWWLLLARNWPWSIIDFFVGFERVTSLRRRAKRLFPEKYEINLRFEIRRIRVKINEVEDQRA